MAKVPVTLLFNVDDKASPGLAKINQALQRLEGVAGGFNSSLKDRLSGFDQISKASKALGQSAIGVGAALTASITAPLVAIGSSAIKTSADYEQAMNNLGVRTEASKEDMILLGAESRRLGLSTVFGAKQAVEAMTELGKAGFGTKDIISGAGSVLNLAAGEMIETSRAATIVANTIGQFGLKAEDAARVTDVLGKAAGISQIEIEDLVNTFKYAAKPANDYGVSLERLGAITATLGKFGIKSETAGTALRSFFTTITSDATKIDKLQKAGLGWDKVFTDKTLKKMLPIEEVFQNLKNLKLSDVQLGGIFDRESAGNIKTLIDNVGLLRENITKTYDAAGFEAGVAAAQTKGFWGEWARLKNAVTDFYITLSEGDGGPLEVLTGFIGKARELVGWFKGLSPETRNFGLAILGVGAVLGPLIGAFGLFLTVLPSMIAGFTALTTAAGIFSGVIGTALGAITLLSGPIGLVVAGSALAIAGLIGLGVTIYKQWDVIGAKLQWVWDMIKNITVGAGSFLNKGLAMIGQESMFLPAANPRAEMPFSGEAFNPRDAVNNVSMANQKNELFVNLGGNIPLGTTVKEGSNNTSDLKLKLGGAMQ